MISESPDDAIRLEITPRWCGLKMKKVRLIVFAPAVLALAACGQPRSHQEQSQPDNAELPAEETVQDLPENATPTVDSSGEAAPAATPAIAR